MRKLKYAIVCGFWIVAVVTAVSTATAEENNIREIYDRYLALCEEYVLPNSMARPEGFDINAHLKQIKEEKDKVVLQLSTEEGLNYVRSRLESTTDDLERQCATDLIKTRQKPK